VWEATIALPVTRLLLATAVLCCGIARGAAPSYSAAGIVSTGSYAPGPFAPNSLITIFGSSLAPGPRGLLPSDIVNNILPTELNNTRVFVDNFAVPLLYVSETQVNLLIPARQALGKADIQVVRQGLRGPVVVVEVAAAAPALFLNGDFAIATHADNSVITPEKPARPGELVVLYAAGLGKTQANPANGELVPYLSPLLGSLRVTVGGETVDPARVLYGGLTPQSAGLYQVNFMLPEKPAADPEIRLFVGDAGSPVGVKLPLR
jgi:uncharacterized protein (TIGR03437 family)